MGTRQAHRATGGWWLAYLTAGVLVIVAYYVSVEVRALPVVRVVLYCAVSASAALAVLVGCLYNLPPGRARLPWLVLGCSQVVYAVADVFFYVSHNILDDNEFPAPADSLYLAHYPLVVVGLLLLIRRRTPGHDRAGLLDAATVAVAATMLSWLYLIEPSAQGSSSALVKIFSGLYPVMDLLMFAVALRLLLGPGRRPGSFVLLSVNLLAILTADTVYVIQQLDGTYQTGNALDAIWLCGNLALGAAALHPTAGKVAERASEDDARLTPFRLFLLAAAALIAPATLFVQHALGSLRDIPVIAAACAILFILTIGRLAGLVADQRLLAITDVLTGLRTRRFFSTQLPMEIARARRAGTNVAVLIVDVDHFKSVNDRYGHPAGDRVLVEVARRLRDSVRHADFLARYGGEEFALVVPDASPQELASIGERLRTEIASSPFLVSPEVWIAVTVSVGTAGYPWHGSTPSELITAADRALYAAKSQGRDRVVVGDVSLPAKLVLPAGRPVPEPTSELLAYLQRVADEVDGWLSGSEHGRAVGRWSALVAATLGEDEALVRRVELAGRLHDVGKVCIPEDIWRKPGALSKHERQLVEQHPDYGFQMVRVVPGLADVADAVRQHHERVDGQGYPLGLAGQEISLEARIIAVCDSWAAMRADRPYHAAKPAEEACEELLRGKGGQFDSAVVDVFLELHRQDRLGELRKLGQQAGALLTP
ncbi:MAG: diguanylate cyclase [Amycolatopsis sp.]|jgi:two-component system cell cycle response regulator|uniref:diguanylate cyclase n=1 Tax=Amycolatopsis sp. TaxID=37632 RepID=UPI00262C5DFF|nr:diguanylate cyclase [Amycolatopsis sp.]MCU1682834.1 diguanylate cyclase [Amycolatopsis sp.]